MTSPAIAMQQGSATPGLSDETTSLNYLKWDDKFMSEKPFEILSQVPKGYPKSNFSLAKGKQQKIHDIRARGISNFNLDENGFQIFHSRLGLADFTAEKIEAEYLPYVNELLQTVDPGAEVFIFDWKLRSSDPAKSSFRPGANVDLDDPMLCLGPVHVVHVDQSAGGATKRVKHHMGERADALLKRRFRIINVWRPISHTVENYPLAVCDGSTVPPENLVEADHVRKYYVGESLYVLDSPDLRWYFLDKQTKDEVLLFKTFDSKEGVKAKCCPHTSFVQGKASANARPRESIEVRALVFSQS